MRRTTAGWVDAAASRWLRQAANSRRLALVLAAVGVALTLDARRSEGLSANHADLKHFFEFAEAAFSTAPFDYYASVAGQAFTYAHLPLFPLLLAPFHRLAVTVGWEPILMVKGLIHTFEIATFALIVLYGRRQGVPVVPATLLGLAWLTARWLFTAAALHGHVTQVAAFFMVAAMLRRDVPWQAGALMALATATRTEFVIVALALAGWYARRGMRPGLAYLVGGAGIAAVIVGPYLLRDAGALHWGVIGHLQGRGNGLRVLREIVSAFDRELPASLLGPQDWAMPAAVALAAGIGWISRDRALGLFRATLVYVLALTIEHERYFVLPLTAGTLAAATSARWPVGLAVHAAEALAPIPGSGRWLMRAGGIAVFLAWPVGQLARRRIRAHSRYR
jgi:hypothetical protein